MLKGLDAEGGRRHSPVDGEGTFRPGGRADSPGAGSSNPQPHPLFAQSAGSLAGSPHSAKFGHRSRGSTDSVSSNLATRGSVIPDEAGQLGQLMRGGMNINEIISSRNNDSRRFGHEGGRPTPLEIAGGDRSAGSSEPPSSAKDSKSFLSFLSRKKKQREDGALHSPDDLESPTSPGLHFKPHSLGSRGNPSETSLDVRPASSLGPHDTNDVDGPIVRQSRAGRTFILATMDGWNYRMCDITDGESPAELRQIICANLGLMDAGHTQMYLTELGKFEHDEPLDDQKLLAQKRVKGDSVGSLKFFVRPVGYMSHDEAHAASLDMTLGVPTDEGQDRTNGSRNRSSSSPPSARQNAGIGDRLGDTSLNHEANQYRVEMERKQKEYLAKRKQAAAIRDGQPSPDSANGFSIAGRSVDFDQPRQSPYEEKKPEQLFPARKPPAPPSDPSATLIKANSLSKRGGLYQQRSSTGFDGYGLRRPPTLSEESPQEMSEKKSKKPASPGVGGIGAALATMGRGLGAIGQSTAAGRQQPGATQSSNNPVPGEDEQGKEPRIFGVYGSQHTRVLLVCSGRSSGYREQITGG